MNRIIYIILAVLLLFTACKELDVTRFDEDAKVYFYNYRYRVRGDTLTQQDSSSQSFFNVLGNQNTDTVWVYVFAMGNTESFDRPFGIKQINTDSTYAAVPKTHYVPFDDEYVSRFIRIPANQSHTAIPIILIRDETLLLNEYRLEMSLIDNEYFEVAMDTLARFVVKTADFGTKPDIWDAEWKTFFGDWGSEKMRFLRDYVVGSGFNWEERPIYGTGTYYKTKANSELEKYNASLPDGEVLTEPTGTIVTFPTR